MSEQERIEIIAEILEVEEEEVIPQKELQDYDTWDSVAVLSVISIMNEKFDKYPSAKEVLNNKTVSELMEFLQMGKES